MTGRAAECGELVLQRVLADRPCPVRDLYWRIGEATPRARVTLRDDGALAVGLGATVTFDTYFGAFFEMPWRVHTNLGTLGLRVHLDGSALLRVTRRVAGAVFLLHEAVIDGTALVKLPAAVLNFRQHGIVAFELAAGDAPFVFREAAWVALIDMAPAIGLAAVFCTFNREADIAAVLTTLADDTVALARLSRIIVVNQGRPGLAGHRLVAPAAARLSGRLLVIEQANFGGAGGFGRGVLAAIDDAAVDHVVFLDDDIRIEPDSLLRMAAFLSLARGDLAVGGHMLDGVQPTRLYEAGAVIGDRHWTFEPQHQDLNIAEPAGLDRLVDPRPVHYNGWWCFGFPLRLIERFGMPMPCFIRGDDTEFGLRLYGAGCPTVPVPGIAVWHAPFYLKLGGWQLYYETRNTLVAMAVHRAPGRVAVTRRMARQILIHVLTYRYYATALILRGIEDYLRGPAVFGGSPAVLHEGLAALRDAHPVLAVGRATVMAPLTGRKLPRHRLGYLALLTRVVLRNWTAPTRPSPPRTLNVENFSWVSVADAEHVALETWWDQEMPGLQRSRTQFRALAPRALRLLAALYRHGPAAAAAWRTAHPTFTSMAFWRGYLAVPAPAPPEALRVAAE